MGPQAKTAIDANRTQKQPKRGKDLHYATRVAGIVKPFDRSTAEIFMLWMNKTTNENRIFGWKHRRPAINVSTMNRHEVTFSDYSSKAPKRLARSNKRPADGDRPTCCTLDTDLRRLPGFQFLSYSPEQLFCAI